MGPGTSSERRAPGCGLGHGADGLTIFSTHPGETTVRAGAGADTINVRTISGATTIDGGEGADVVNVGSLSPAAGGSVDGIGATLVVGGGNDANADTLNIDDRADLAGNVGVLNGHSVTGLGMAAGIEYSGIEALNVDLGSGADVFNVRGTSAVTNVRLHVGDDRIYVSSAANADLLSAATIDFLAGNLDGLQGALNVDAGAGRHRLMVSDEGATAGDGDVRISDVAPIASGSGLSSTAEIWVTGLAAGGISYEASRTDGDFADGIALWTGAGADRINVDGTHQRDGARTTTLLNTGLGDDTVNVDLHAGEDGAFVLHALGGGL
jgi:hypothetical protein